MQRALTPDEILVILRGTPEQAVFDWKQDFSPPRGDTHVERDLKAGELVKDISAIANATAFSHTTGYLFYGVQPKRPDPFIGITETWDDAPLQQLVRSATQAPVEFLFYTVTVRSGVEIAVIELPRSRRPPHVVSRDIGSLREGQILIRDGSTTRGIRADDLSRLYLEVGNGYAEELLRQYGALAALTNARAVKQRADIETVRHLQRQLESISGLPPGSLG